MSCHFDDARPRLVQAGPASDEWDHLQRGLDDGFNPKLPHDRPITWLTVAYLQTLPCNWVHEIVSVGSLSPSFSHPPGIYEDCAAKVTAPKQIESRALASPPA